MLSDKLESNELNFLVIILKLVVFAFSEIVLDVFICPQISQIPRIYLWLFVLFVGE